MTNQTEMSAPALAVDTDGRLSPVARELTAREARRAAVDRGADVVEVLHLFGQASRRAVKRHNLPSAEWEEVQATAVADALAAPAVDLSPVGVGRLCGAAAGRIARAAGREVAAGDGTETIGEERMPDQPRQAPTADDGRRQRAAVKGRRGEMGVPHRADVYGVGEWSRSAMRDPADVLFHTLDDAALQHAMQAPYSPAGDGTGAAWQSLGDDPVGRLWDAYRPLFLATNRTSLAKPGDVLLWRKVEWAALSADRNQERSMSRAVKGWARDVRRATRGAGRQSSADVDGRPCDWADRLAARQVVRFQVGEMMMERAMIGTGTAPVRSERAIVQGRRWQAPTGDVPLSSKDGRRWQALDRATDRGAWSMVIARSVVRGPLQAPTGAASSVYVDWLTLPSSVRYVTACKALAERSAAAVATQRQVNYGRRVVRFLTSLTGA